MIKYILLSIFMIMIPSYAYGGGPSMVNSLEDAIALSESTKKPILLIFSAEWCGFCKSLKKDIDNSRLSKELDGLIICYIDTDKNPDLKKQFDIKSLPDSRVLINNQEKYQHKGYIFRNYKRWLNSIER